MTLAGKIKELMELRMAFDKNKDSSFFDLLHYETTVIAEIPKLLDALEIQAEALGDIPGVDYMTSMTEDGESEQWLNEGDVTRIVGEAQRRVDELFKE